MNQQRENNPVYNPEATKSVDDFFSRFNKRPFKTLGDELSERGPDALIAAFGAQMALSNAEAK
jgi:hypothetical protein